MAGTTLVGLLTVILFWQTQATVQFGNDLTKIQASQLVMFNSTSVLSGVPTMQSTFNFFQAFSSVPEVFHTICSFKIQNSKQILYQTTLVTKTSSSAVFQLMIGSQTGIYQLTLYAIAFDFWGIYATYTSYIPSVCNTKSLTVSCSQSFPVPVQHTNFYLVPSLVSLNLSNFYSTVPLASDKSYTFQIDSSYYTNSTDNNSYFSISVTPTIQVYNFTIGWIVTPVDVGNSDNISFVQDIEVLANSGTSSLINLYSPDYTVNNQSGVTGLLGFIFDYKNILNFDVMFPSPNTVQATITTTVIPIVTPKVTASTVVLGGPLCNSTQFLWNYPQASCYPCNLSICASCAGVLCASCSLPRYLMITNSTTGGGTCVCSTGYIQIQGICVACDQSCLDCLGDADSCISCSYGYIMINNKCVQLCYVVDTSISNSDGCVQCPEGCSVCESSINCTRTICDPTNYYYNDSCYSNCPTGTFTTTVNSVLKCQQCNDGCASCNSESACLTCGAGYYIDSTDNSCGICDFSCLTCSNSGNTNCLSCVYGTPVSGVCTNPSFNLIGCPSALFYSSSSASCQQCPTNCTVCNSTSQCLECNQDQLLQGQVCVNCDTIIGYVLINGQCVELCGDGIKIYAACDDKNTNDGDGCSSSCQIEKGFFCESNTVANMGDICYRSNATLAIQQSKSVIDNTLRFKVDSPDVFLINIQSIILNCSGDFSVMIMSYLLKNHSLEVVVSYNGDMEGQQCRLTLTDRLISEFKVSTYPAALVLSQEAMTQARYFANILLNIAWISIVCVLVSHLICPTVTSTFTGYFILFVVSLFNRAQMPLVVYTIISSIRPLTLTFDSRFLNDYYSTNFILGYELNHFTRSIWPISVMCLVFIIITLVLWLVRQKLGSKSKILFRHATRRPHKLVHSTILMYESLVVTTLVFSLRGVPNTIDFAMIGIEFLKFIASLVMIHKILTSRLTVSSKSFLMGGSGILLRIQSYLYTLMVICSYPSDLCLGPMVSLLLGIIVICLRVHHNLIRCREQMKLEQLQLEDLDDYQPQKVRIRKFKSMACSLKIFQFFYNDLAFLLQNTAIFALYVTGNERTHETTSYGIAMIANLTVFTIINTIIILLAVTVRLRKTFVCCNTKIYPKQSEVSRAEKNENGEKSSQNALNDTIYSTNLRFKARRGSIDLQKNNLIISRTPNVNDVDSIKKNGLKKKLSAMSNEDFMRNQVAGIHSSQDLKSQLNQSEICSIGPSSPKMLAGRDVGIPKKGKRIQDLLSIQQI